MSDIYNCFLGIIQSSLSGSDYFWDPVKASFHWKKLFDLAEIHHLLPLMTDQLYRCESFQRDIIRNRQGLLLEDKVKKSLELITGQMVRTDRFVELCQYLGELDLVPTVVKGITLRSYYMRPEYRISIDEDFYVEDKDFARYHQALLDFGLQSVGKNDDLQNLCETAYEDIDTHLHIELHKQLIPESSAAYGHLNRYFTSSHRSTEIREIRSPINSTRTAQIKTLSPSDHLFFLILHAYKHFAHSGFGIRQICDICILSEIDGWRIGWDTLWNKCRDTKLEYFTAAIFKIGEKYLGFDREKAHFPNSQDISLVDEQPLLKDILNGGVYGTSSRKRIHSSNITLQALAENKPGKKHLPGNVMHAVFLPLSSMKRKYPYLEKYPIMLPAAWIHRIARYIKENHNRKLLDSVKVGEQRIELLRYYHII